jgi:hypothetical protein
MNIISYKTILQQLQKDLIGKDSYRGITFSYAWLANQLGHFTLGFIPTLLLFLYLEDRSSNPAWVAAFCVGGCWLLFEIYNFLGPLFKAKKQNQELGGFIFQPPWKHVAHDTFTDLLFFWFGGLMASLFLQFDWGILYVLIALSMVMTYCGIYWYRNKMYWQEAQFPMQFRLSQFNKPLSKQNKSIIQAFLDHPGEGRHLIIFGNNNSGKTSLSIGIGTERTLKSSNCLYTSAIKLYSMFYDEPIPLSGSYQHYWNWRHCSLLIIDDINPGSPIENDLIQPDQLLSIIRNSPYCQANLDALKSKDVIWVMGNRGSYETRTIPWVDMLKSIGISPDNISKINLMELDDD